MFCKINKMCRWAFLRFLNIYKPRMQLRINVIQFWASIVPMMSMIKWQCHSCYCYHYCYCCRNCYYHHFLLSLLLLFSWCAVLTNMPGLRDSVVMRVLSDFYWTAATHAASIMRPLSRGRPRDNSAVHGASEDVPGMTYDVPGVSYPIPWTSGDCPQGVRPADGPGTHSLASTGPFSQAAVHRASGLLRFSQSQRGRIMDRKWGCPQYVRNRKLMSRSCPGNATATLLAALTFFVENKLILL